MRYMPKARENALSVKENLARVIFNPQQVLSRALQLSNRLQQSDLRRFAVRSAVVRAGYVSARETVIYYIRNCIAGYL